MWVIVVDADPRQGVKDSLRPLGLVARLIGVFNTQNEHTVVGEGQNPVV